MNQHKEYIMTFELKGEPPSEMVFASLSYMVGLIKCYAKDNINFKCLKIERIERADITKEVKDEFLADCPLI